MGAGSVVVALINLIANACWLQTGDIHRPDYHVGMRGGWTGFWITTVVFSGLLIVGLALLLAEWRARRTGAAPTHPSRGQPHKPRMQPRARRRLWDVCAF
jgi:uncharacterized membrane protein